MTIKNYTQKTSDNIFIWNYRGCGQSLRCYAFLLILALSTRVCFAEEKAETPPTHAEIVTAVAGSIRWVKANAVAGGIVPKHLQNDPRNVLSGFQGLWSTDAEFSKAVINHMKTHTDICSDTKALKILPYAVKFDTGRYRIRVINFLDRYGVKPVLPKVEMKKADAIIKGNKVVDNHVRNIMRNRIQMQLNPPPPLTDPVTGKRCMSTMAGGFTLTKSYLLAEARIKALTTNQYADYEAVRELEKKYKVSKQLKWPDQIANAPPGYKPDVPKESTKAPTPVIKLKSGKSIQGKIVMRTKTHALIKLEDGKLNKILLEDLALDDDD